MRHRGLRGPPFAGAAAGPALLRRASASSGLVFITCSCPTCRAGPPDRDMSPMVVLLSTDIPSPQDQSGLRRRHRRKPQRSVAIPELASSVRTGITLPAVCAGWRAWL